VLGGASNHRYKLPDLSAFGLLIITQVNRHGDIVYVINSETNYLVSDR